MMRHDSVANLLRCGNDSDDEFVEITVKRVNATGNAVIQMEGNIIGGVLCPFVELFNEQKNSPYYTYS